MRDSVIDCADRRMLEIAHNFKGMHLATLILRS